METGAYRNAFHHIANHARTAARGDDGVDARTAGHIGGLQFGPHAAGAEARDAVARDGAQRIVDTFYIGDQFRLRVGTRIGGKEPLLVGEQQQLVCARQNGGQRRKVIVIADFDFCGGDRIVLVNDRHDVVIQQGAQGVAGVQETLPVFHIGAGQQHLPDVNAIDGEQLFPELNQAALSYRRQQLLGGNSGREFGVTQVFTPGGNRPGGDNHNTVPCGVQLRALAHQFNDMGAIKAARSAC